MNFLDLGGTSAEGKIVD